MPRLRLVVPHSISARYLLLISLLCSLVCSSRIMRRFLTDQNASSFEVSVPTRTTLLALNYPSQHQFWRDTNQLFDILDVNTNGVVDEREFVQGMLDISSYENRTDRAVFTGFEAMLDTDADAKPLSHKRAKTAWASMWTLFSGQNDSMTEMDRNGFVTRYQRVYTKSVYFDSQLCLNASKILQEACQNDPKRVYRLMEQGAVLTSLNQQCNKGISALSDHQVEHCILDAARLEAEDACPAMMECMSKKQLKQRSARISSLFTAWMTMAGLEETASFKSDTRISLSDWTYSYNNTLFSMDVDALGSELDNNGDGVLGPQEYAEIHDAVDEVLDRRMIAPQTTDTNLDRRRELLMRYILFNDSASATGNQSVAEFQSHTLARASERILFVDQTRCTEVFHSLIGCHSHEKTHRKLLNRLYHQYHLCLNGYYAAVGEPSVMRCSQTHEVSGCATIRECVSDSLEEPESELQSQLPALRKRFIPALVFFLGSLITMTIADLLLPFLIAAAVATLAASYVLTTGIVYARFRTISSQNLRRVNETHVLLPSKRPSQNDHGEAGPNYDPFDPNRHQQVSCTARMYWGSCGIPKSTEARSCPEGGRLFSPESCNSFYRFNEGSLMCGTPRAGVDKQQADEEWRKARESWRNQTTSGFNKMRYQLNFGFKFMCQSLCIKYEGSDCPSQ